MVMFTENVDWMLAENDDDDDDDDEEDDEEKEEWRENLELNILRVQEVIDL